MPIPKDQRAELVRQVRQHLLDEFELEVGELQGGLLLDYFESLLGPVAYNLAVEHARAIVAARALSIDEEIFGLTRSPDRGRGPS